MEDEQRQKFSEMLEQWATGYDGPSHFNAKPERVCGQIILDAHLHGFLESDPAISRLIDERKTIELASLPPRSQRRLVSSRELNAETLGERVLWELCRFMEATPPQLAGAVAKLIRGERTTNVKQPGRKASKAIAERSKIIRDENLDNTAIAARFGLSAEAARKARERALKPPKT